MSRNNTTLFILLLMLGILAESCGDPHRRGGNEIPEEELSRLDKTIKSADLYMRDKNSSLDTLARELAATPATDVLQRWKLCNELAAGYLVMHADSSLYYSEKGISIAREAGLEREEIIGRISRINALSTAGIFTRALEEFKALESVPADTEMKIRYWSAGRKLFGYMSMYVEDDMQFYDEYNARYLQYDDSLLSNLPASDPMYQFYHAERLVSNAKYNEAKQELAQLIKNTREESNLYAMAAYQMGMVSKFEGNNTGYASWLAKAAISDIKGCVKDGLALPALAEWLYNEGELDIAFQYINFAMEESTSGNVRMRTVSIASLLPAIDDAYREKINASRDELMIYFLLVTFLLVITIALIVMMVRTIRKSRRSERKLARTAELQESYIGNFIGLSSTYATRLESLQKIVTRKLAAGQSDELLKMMKNGKFGDDNNNEDFYKIFDSAFLDIYPDFIGSINELLRPEERIELHSERELTPEIRIYALVRLGVNESTRISQILNYSVSTVYAYRNRMRNKALSRDSFDADVMKIGKNLVL